MLFYIMSDQPDCCPKCQTRLDFVEEIMIDDEHVFVKFCDECQREVLFVED
jgi:predicted  nucleic acid-binding Zn ribbon protein